MSANITKLAMGILQRILTHDKIRLYTDLIVFGCHLVVTASIFGVDSEFAKTTQGKILISLESITMFFHLFYCIAYYNNAETMKSRQPWKWLEYAAR